MINGLVTDFPTEDLIDRIRLLDNNKLRMPISPSLQCLIDITEPSMLHIVGKLLSWRKITQQTQKHKKTFPSHKSYRGPYFPIAKLIVIEFYFSIIHEAAISDCTLDLDCNSEEPRLIVRPTSLVSRTSTAMTSLLLGVNRHMLQ